VVKLAEFEIDYWPQGRPEPIWIVDHIISFSVYAKYWTRIYLRRYQAITLQPDFEIDDKAGRQIWESVPGKPVVLPSDRNAGKP
jgi:hypothetical protein